MNLISFIRNHLRDSFDKYKEAKQLYDYDCDIFVSHSACFGINNQTQMLAIITAREHVLEKGLTMPNMQLGFGKDNLCELIRLLLLYRESEYDTNNLLYIQAIKNIEEYRKVHREAGYKLDDDILAKIQTLMDIFSNITVDEGQTLVERENFFPPEKCSFEEFAQSRHTCRNYEGSISIDIIKAAVKLATTAPSACNRQPVRVKIVTDRNIKDKILSIQCGNRGFGDKADKLIIITSNVSIYNVLRERNCAYIDGGIFLMNMLYALHYYKIGACTLNWSSTIEDDKAIHSLLNIPCSEVVVGLIACGIPSKQFKIAVSKRLEAESIMTIY